MKKYVLGTAVGVALISWLFLGGPLKELTKPSASTQASQGHEHALVGSESVALSTTVDGQPDTISMSTAAGSKQTPSTSTSNNALPDARASADRLPVERNFLSGKNVDSAATQTILQSKRFGDVMHELKKEAMRDSLTVDQTNVYQAAMQREAARIKSTVQIQNFACGLRICMGSMHSTDQTQFNDWMKEFLSNKSTPKYAVTSYTVNLGGGNYEHRFLFSTDPTSNGFAVPMPPAH